MKKSWPRIKKVTLHGKTSFMVDARFEGKGSRNFFGTRSEAEGFAQSARIRRENEGGTVFDDRGLARHGWTVAMAIRFALDHLNSRAASVTVPEAVERMITSKAGAGRDALHLANIKRKLGKFAAHVGEKKMLAEVKPADVEAYLVGMNAAPGTWNTHRKIIASLFSYGIKASLCTTNPAAGTESAKGTDTPPAIFTPSEAAALLSASEGDVLAYHAIGFFAGLRVSEIHRLDWSDVDLAGGYVHVSAAKSKTRARRLVPILLALREWITPVAKASGPIIGDNFRKRQEAAREAAGLAQWPANGMRHSFVSYRLADTGNAAMTALEAGHDQKILFAHYREIVKPQDAARYFAIRPEAPGKSKITPISQAA